MEIIFTKSKWEMWDDPLVTFLERSVRDQFDAVELYLPALEEGAKTIKKQVEDHNLQLVAQINTEGETPNDHIECLRHRFEFAVETEPLLVNSHTGSDIFSFMDNLGIFEEAIALSRDANVMLVHETHRGRPTFAATTTAEYLDALPELKLNADFSHWFCVHESDLSNQPENVALAIRHSYHIHARVGFEEGPQIPDPSAPEWQSMVDKFINLWQLIIDERKKEGEKFLTITPEFGPPDYMPCEPFTRKPLADAWEVNVAFHKVLENRLKP